MAEKKGQSLPSEVVELARAAGLAQALEHFADDVSVAAQSAASSRSAAGAIDLIAAEPWPPMRVRDTR